MTKKILSVLMVIVMLFTAIPTGVFASESAMGDGSENNPYQPGDVVITNGENEPEGTTAEHSYWERTKDVPAEILLSCEKEVHSHEECEINEEGLYLCGTEEHSHSEENACYSYIDAYTVWTLKELSVEVTDTAALAGSVSVTVSRYRNIYVAINDSVYYVNNSGVIENLDGTVANFESGSYTVYYGTLGQMARRNFYKGTFTVTDTDSGSKSVSLSSTSYGTVSPNYTADQYRFATSVYYNTRNFDHVHIRVEGSYVLNIGGASYTATVSNPSMKVYSNNSLLGSYSWSGTTSYEWTYRASLSRSANLEVELTLDLTYTDKDGKKVTLEDVTVNYSNTEDRHKYIEAIAICDGVSGLDFTVTVEDIVKELNYYSVSYEWKVYNTDGTYTSLPAGAPNEPASVSGIEENSSYVYDTEYVTGTSFYDYDKGLLYSFHGWDVYSHSTVFNVNEDEGYYALDDGDADSSNNKDITITADTYIYGYWTVTKLSPSSAFIVIDKKIEGLENDADALKDAELVWFRIDTGYDGDGDGITIVDVDYSQIVTSKANDSEYRLPVYQYDIPFVISEHNAEVRGYSLTSSVKVEGNNVSGENISGDTVNVTLTPLYQGENNKLGTITFTNAYEKNIGTPIENYPALTVLKSASDNNSAFLDGAEFTLYSDESLTNKVDTFVTSNGGIVSVSFENLSAGTYYLKETKAPAGYILSDEVFKITLSVGSANEELLWNESADRYEFTKVTNYVLSVSLPENSDAIYQENGDYFRLHIYNDPILGRITLNKFTEGLEEKDISELEAIVILHGPVTRDSENNITSLGNTHTLKLDASNNHYIAVNDLHLGEYLIHESFASVHGYTWLGVKYELNGTEPETEVYNNITSALVNITEENRDLEINLKNTYEGWNEADFYIRKVNENGEALRGAEFKLYYDENCTLPVENAPFTVSAVSGADGYAHFEGFTVSADSLNGTETYYLKETKAPEGYYLIDEVYKVEISIGTDARTRKFSYLTSVYVYENGNWVEADFDKETDLLTVVNYPVKGSITITKDIFSNYPDDNNYPVGLRSVTVNVSGENSFLRTVTLNADNNWKVTLEDLPLGVYTVTEADASVPGYTLNVLYIAEGTESNESAVLNLTEENKGYTKEDAEIKAEALIINNYERNEETFEIPTSITVRKVNSDNEPLKGAEFTLTKLDLNGNALSSVTYVTGSDGTVVFDLLSGFIGNESGEPIDGKYILTETKAPEGYKKTDTVWTITVTEDDGKLRIKLNEEKNIFENFWDWIVGSANNENYEFAGNILTIENEKLLGKLEVIKEVKDEKERNTDSEYSFTLILSDREEEINFTLKNGEKFTLENIPYGTVYELTENTEGAAFVSEIIDEANSVIFSESTSVKVINEYKYKEIKLGLDLIKIDGETKLPLKGAEFTLYSDADLLNIVAKGTTNENGRLNLPVTEVGTYFLKETNAPEGYHTNDTVYEVKAEEVYRLINAGNESAETEIILKVTASGLEGKTEDGTHFIYTVENTAIKVFDISVKKVFNDGDYYLRPDAVEAVLYRDGEVYDTVKLSAENNFFYIWKDLTDEFVWSVDEINIPDEYKKTVTREGNNFTITNTREEKSITITVTKAWDHKGGKNNPDSIVVTLFKDNEAYENQVLSEENNWTYTWENLTDASLWSIDETEVPEGYEKEITVNGYEFLITNTRSVNLIEVSVEKEWYGKNVTHPDSVEVTLFKDGKEHDKVTLSSANNWSHTWKDLTDEFTWTVDEVIVPDGYKKEVRNNGLHFIITNTHKDIPKTGDFFNASLWGTLGITSFAGFIVTGTKLLLTKKKEDDKD